MVMCTGISGCILASWSRAVWDDPLGDLFMDDRAGVATWVVILALAAYVACWLLALFGSTWWALSD